MSAAEPAAWPAGLRSTSNRHGILWMLLAIFLFVSMDAIAKMLLTRYPLEQVTWFRFVSHLVLVAVLLAPRLSRLAVSRRPGLQLVRSGLLAATTFAFFTALSAIPLADNSAIMLLGPIIVTILAWPLLGEPVGTRRWVGVLIGFAGAMIILRPGSGMLAAGAGFALLAAFSFAFYQITTRVLSRHDSPFTTILYSPLVGAMIASVLVVDVWVPPDPVDGLMLVTVGALGGVGHFAMIKSLTLADAPTVVPFTYSNLVWATLFGLALFGDLPDAYTLGGAALIVGSGLYIFHREQVRVRGAAAGS